MRAELAAQLRGWRGGLLAFAYRPRRWLGGEALLAAPPAGGQVVALAAAELTGAASSAERVGIDPLASERCGSWKPSPPSDHLAAQLPQTLLITDFYDNLSVASSGALLAPFSQQLQFSQVLPPEANRFLRGDLQPRRLPQRLQGPCLSLLSLWAVNYYHWLFDALPRLELIRRSGLLEPLLATGRQPTLLLPEPISGFHRDSLALLGLGGWPLRTVGPQAFLRCRELLLADLPSADTSLWTGPARAGGLEPWVVAFLRRAFLGEAGGWSLTGDPAASPDRAAGLGGGAAGLREVGRLPDAPGPAPAARPAPDTQAAGPLRLYLSRAAESRRGVAGEDLLLPLLRRFGIQQLDPAQLSFAEQIALFRRAEWVIAPHGAALANTVFCPPGALVVEIFAAGFQPGMYASLAERIGARYRALVVEPGAAGATAATLGATPGASAQALAPQRNQAAGSASGVRGGAAAAPDPQQVGDRRTLTLTPALLERLEAVLSDA